MSSVCHHALVSTPSLGDTGRHRHRAACVHAVQAAAGPRGSSNGTPAATPSMQQPAQLWPQAPPTAAQPQPIQTQRGIPTFKPVIPDSPCAECAGLGRVTCGECRCVRADGGATVSLRMRAVLSARPQPCLPFRPTGVLLLRVRCRGKGRLNYRGSSMLPQGVWPEW